MFILDVGSLVNFTWFYLHVPSWRSLVHLSCLEEVLYKEVFKSFVI